MNHGAMMQAGGATRAATTPVLPRRWGPRKGAPGYEISTRRSVARVTVAIGGSPTIEQLISTLHVFGIENGAQAHESMLIDLRKLDSVYTRTDLLLVGHEIACSFAHLSQLALLVLPHRVTRISERAARRAGMNMRVFDNEQMADAWLQLRRHAHPASRLPS